MQNSKKYDKIWKINSAYIFRYNEMYLSQKYNLKQVAVYNQLWKQINNINVSVSKYWLQYTQFDKRL